MDKTGSIVLATTLFVVLYVAIASISSSFALVFFMFLMSVFLFIKMVITILKTPYQSTKTFDKYYYEDEDIRVGSR